MTKEELEKEIRKYLKKTFHHEYYDDVVKVMGFAEPREKRIAELEDKLANADYQLEGRDNEIRELEAQIEELKEELAKVCNLKGCGRIKELEAQIEKMKNCRNCKNEKIEGACGHFTQVGWCKNWELAD